METKNEASSERRHAQLLSLDVVALDFDAMASEKVERGDGKREAPKSLRTARMLKKQARSAM